MRSDILRQLTLVVAFVFTFAMNIASNALPFNGQGPGEVSDRFSVFVVPAAYVFTIWGVIYSFLLAYTIWQALPRNRELPALRAIGYLPALAGLLNAVWLVLFQFEVWVAALAVMAGLLVTLIVIHQRLWAHRAGMSGRDTLLVRTPFSIYLGWITVATIANVAQTLAAIGFTGFGLPPEVLAAVVLLVGLAIAATFVTRYRDVAYGLVIVWAYAGIVVKEQDTALVAAAAGLGALVVAVLVVLSLARRGGGTQAPVRSASPA
jgi:hypothetical protein